MKCKRKKRTAIVAGLIAITAPLLLAWMGFHLIRISMVDASLWPGYHDEAEYNAWAGSEPDTEVYLPFVNSDPAVPPSAGAWKTPSAGAAKYRPRPDELRRRVAASESASQRMSESVFSKVLTRREAGKALLLLITLLLLASVVLAQGGMISPGGRRGLHFQH
jgi:hypothetical protein